jgi:hypothetical protein
MKEKEIFEAVLQSLPHTPNGKDQVPGSNWHGFWANHLDDEIMCPDEASADTLADFFEDCGFDIMHTHFYDDNHQSFVVNEDCFGYWSVYPDG